MGLFSFLFNDTDEAPKRIFTSFAHEDSRYRDFLVQQAKSERSPFEFIDMSVKQPWNESEWKKRCRTKIKRCHGVIVLLSNHTYHAGGVRWEIRCAKEEGLAIIGMHINKHERYAVPPELKGNRIITWSWKNLTSFVNNL